MPYQDAYGRWRSDEGLWWWDGNQWLPVPKGPQTGWAVASAVTGLIMLAVLGLLVALGLLVVIVTTATQQCGGGQCWQALEPAALLGWVFLPAGSILATLGLVRLQARRRWRRYWYP